MSRRHVKSRSSSSRSPAASVRRAGPETGDVGWIATRLGEWIAGGGRLVLLIDYDGTLTPIVPSPEEAWLPEVVRGNLRTLARAPGILLGIVSGRDLADVRERVGVAEAIYAGSHGLEIEGPGLRFLHPEAEAQRGALVSMTLTLSLRANTVRGLHVEPKRFGVALHYRHVEADQQRRVETELARAIHQEGGRVRVFHGNRVIEVQPQVAWGKGECALWIRDAARGAAESPVMTVYMGDDWTDERAFEVLEGAAMTIKVGDGAPASRASYHLPEVADAQRLVTALAAVVTGRCA